tara:strand:- start:195 stop:359 length:165 start_codon:yes stop_codon:yes gene_type:complete
MLDNKIKNLSVVLNSVEHIKGAFGGSYDYGGYYEDEPKESKVHLRIFLVEKNKA